MLTNILIHFFTKKGAMENPDVRFSYGNLTGIVGITVNFLLFVLKLTVGLLSGSIAIAADAANNLSDAGSAVVTLFGFKLSVRPADEEHPFGHGRLEYVAGLIVSVIIISVGIDFLKESVMKLFHAEKMDMDTVLLWIYAGSMLFKVWLFFFYRSIGTKIKSGTIMAAAFDSLSDLLSTGVVLAAVIIAKITGTSFPIDGCAGILVAGLVIVGGLKVLKETMSPLLGELPDPELVEKLRKKLLSCKDIRGVHDIIIHNYGPNQYFATAHAEIKQEGDLVSAHDLLEAAEVEVAKTLPIKLILHGDPFDTEDPHIKDWRTRTENAVSDMDKMYKLYDFSVDESDPQGRILSFHLLIPREGLRSEEQIQAELLAIMQKHDPRIRLNIEFKNAYI